MVRGWTSEVPQGYRLNSRPVSSPRPNLTRFHPCNTISPIPQTAFTHPGVAQLTFNFGV